MEWFDLAHSRYSWRALVNALKKQQVLYNARNFLTSWGRLRFWRTLLYGINFRRCVCVDDVYQHVQPSYYVTLAAVKNPGRQTMFYVTLSKGIF